MMEQTLAIADLDERYGRLRLGLAGAQRWLRDSMEKLGQLHAVVACARGDRLPLVDGFKRLSAARELGLTTLRVRVLELSETAAIAAVMTLNGGGRGLTDLEQAMCVRALVRDQGLAQNAVAELLGYDKSWVCRRLALAERLCEDVANDVRAGLITTSVAREVARLPRGNQPEVAAAIAKGGLTSQQGATLVTLYEKASTGGQRKYVLQHPREAVDAHQTPAFGAQDPRLGPDCEFLRRRLFAALRLLSELGARIEDTTPTRWTDTEREVLVEVVGRVQGVSALVTGKLSSLQQVLAGTVVGGGTDG